eukprot:scaffold7508_cov65-Skeletonema_dohrnii-CCMP3373.AAC.1
MGSDNDDASGKRKGRKVWLFVKNASMALTVFMFFLTVILVLDAYKFVSIRHAKFARKKVLTTLQYMDPALIEAHTGMKVLTNEEFESLNSELEETRSKIREMNGQVQQKYSAVLKVICNHCPHYNFTCCCYLSLSELTINLNICLVSGQYYVKAQMDLQNMKSEIEELKKVAA